MTATPWVDCDGKLLVDEDGSPWYCETDPCPQDDDDEPQTVGCITAPGSFFGPGDVPGSLTFTFAGSNHTSGGYDFATSDFCLCREFFGTFVVPYTGGSPCLHSGTYQHVWQETFSGLNTGAFCTSRPGILGNPPSPEEIDLHVEAAVGLINPITGVVDSCGLSVRILGRFLQAGTQQLYAVPNGRAISRFSASGPYHPSDPTYGKAPDGFSLDFVNGFNLTPALHTSGSVAGGCPDSSWLAGSNNWCYYGGGNNTTPYAANVTSRLEPA